MKAEVKVENLELSFWAPNGSRIHDLPDTGLQPVSGRSWVRLPLEAQKILFLSNSTWERFFIIYTLSKSPIHVTYHLLENLRGIYYVH